MKHENLWVAFAAAGTSIAVLAGAATAALAQQQTTTTVIGERVSEDVRIARVSYRDLNLVSARDERILLRRVSGAIRQVCTDGDTAVEGVGFAPCARDARRNARPQIALAVKRAHEMAAYGTSSIPMVAIAITAR